MLGFRYPWTWGFVLLTKVTPGIGLLWFAVRREWRALGIALGVTGAIVAVSLVLDLQLWRDWIAFIGSTPEGGSVAQFNIPIPLWIRLPAAAALVVWGGLTDRRWTVPVAATLALPVLWVSGFAICAALAAESMWPSRRVAESPIDAPRVPGAAGPSVPSRRARGMTRSAATRDRHEPSAAFSTRYPLRLSGRADDWIPVHAMTEDALVRALLLSANGLTSGMSGHSPPSSPSGSPSRS